MFFRRRKRDDVWDDCAGMTPADWEAMTSEEREVFFDRVAAASESEASIARAALMERAEADHERFDAESTRSLEEALAAWAASRTFDPDLN